MIPQFVIPITNRFGESYHFSGQLLTSGEPKTFVTKQEAIEFLESFGELDLRSVEDLFYLIGQFKPNIPDGELTSQHYNSTFANALVNITASSVAKSPNTTSFATGCNLFARSM